MASLGSTLALCGARVVRAETYLSHTQAMGLLFPGQSMRQQTVTLTGDQKKAIAKASDVRVRSDTVQAWRAGSGGWFIVDNVIGKHEFIDIAVGITADGSVKGIEILTYRETYGGEVRHPKWRAQFLAKRGNAPLKVDKDIKNISGATLSCVHVSEGVRRLLQTWELVLRHL